MSLAWQASVLILDISVSLMVPPTLCICWWISSIPFKQSFWNKCDKINLGCVAIPTTTDSKNPKACLKNCHVWSPLLSRSSQACWSSDVKVSGPFKTTAAMAMSDGRIHRNESQMLSYLVHGVLACLVHLWLSRLQLTFLYRIILMQFESPKHPVVCASKIIKSIQKCCSSDPKKTPLPWRIIYYRGYQIQSPGNC